MLLAQTEVGEVAEGAGGGSSTMPHKRNPVARRCRRVRGRSRAATPRDMLAAIDQEHERAAGAWQAEWEALSGALAPRAARRSRVAAAIARLEVDADRMRANLDATGRPGRRRARRSSSARSARARRRARGGPRRRRGRLCATVVAAVLRRRRPRRPHRRAARGALDPTTYLGSAEAFVDGRSSLRAEDA